MRGYLVVLSLVGGCQCLEPVDEGPARDGGTDGGSRADAGAPDAGTDAGRLDAGECGRASDCPVIDGGTFCGGLVASCIDGRCVATCSAVNGPLSCRRSASCLECEADAGFSCFCGARSCRYTVAPQYGDCPPPFVPGQSIEVLHECNAPILIDGGRVGTWVGHSVVEIPALGGTCISEDLPTGSIQRLISCPACAFVGECL